jgi:LPS export ABC transporter permease LptG
MKILDRYLFREFAIPVGYCLVGFSAIFVLFDLLGRLSKFTMARMAPDRMAFFYGCFLIQTIEYLLPTSLLLGGLYAIWQFTRSNEIMAMRASGISLTRIMVPFVAIGMLFVGTSFWVKETLAPKAGFWMSQIQANRYRPLPERKPVQHLAYYSSTERRQWNIGELDLYKPRELLTVRVREERIDGTRLREVFTPKAEYLDGRWWFHGPQVQIYDTDDHPVGGLRPAKSNPDEVLEMPYIGETPSDMAASVKEPDHLTAREMRNYLAVRHGISREENARWRVDIHLRRALPWTCLIVTLFVIPTGAASGRQNALTGIFTAVGLLLGFYTLMQVGMVMGKQQLVEPWMGAWLSNVVFATAGAVMMLRSR